MTEVEMALELTARNRELEEQANTHKNDKLLAIQDNGGTLTDAALLDKGVELLSEGADMNDVLSAMGFGDLGEGEGEQQEISASPEEEGNETAPLSHESLSKEDEDALEAQINALLTN